MSQTPTVTVYSTVQREPYVFIECRWKVDEVGCLHIFQSSGDRNTMVAAFGVGEWSMAHANVEIRS